MSQEQEADLGASSNDDLALVSDQAAARLAPSGFDPSRDVSGEILRPRGCDDEVASIMEQLDRLQTWLVLKCIEQNGDREYRSAFSLIQNTCCLIVERCFKEASK